MQAEHMQRQQDQELTSNSSDDTEEIIMDVGDINESDEKQMHTVFSQPRSNVQLEQLQQPVLQQQQPVLQQQNSVAVYHSNIPSSLQQQTPLTSDRSTHIQHYRNLSPLPTRYSPRRLCSIQQTALNQHPSQHLNVPNEIHSFHVRPDSLPLTTRQVSPLRWYAAPLTPQHQRSPQRYTCSGPTRKHVSGFPTSSSTAHYHRRSSRHSLPPGSPGILSLNRPIQTTSKINAFHPCPPARPYPVFASQPLHPHYIDCRSIPLIHRPQTIQQISTNTSFHNYPNSSIQSHHNIASSEPRIPVTVPTLPLYYPDNFRPNGIDSVPRAVRPQWSSIPIPSLPLRNSDLSNSNADTKLTDSLDKENDTTLVGVIKKKLTPLSNFLLGTNKFGRSSGCSKVPEDSIYHIRNSSLPSDKSSISDNDGRSSGCSKVPEDSIYHIRNSSLPSDKSSISDNDSSLVQSKPGVKNDTTIPVIPVPNISNSELSQTNTVWESNVISSNSPTPRNIERRIKHNNQEATNRTLEDISIQTIPIATNSETDFLPSIMVEIDSLNNEEFDAIQSDKVSYISTLPDYQVNDNYNQKNAMTNNSVIITKLIRDQTINTEVFSSSSSIKIDHYSKGESLPVMLEPVYLSAVPVHEEHLVTSEMFNRILPSHGMSEPVVDSEKLVSPLASTAGWPDQRNEHQAKIERHRIYDGQRKMEMNENNISIEPFLIIIPKSTEDLPSIRNGMDEDLPSIRNGMDEDLPSIRNGMDEDLPSIRNGMNEDLPSIRNGMNEDLPSIRNGMNEDLPSIRNGMNEDLPSIRNGMDEGYREKTDGFNDARERPLPRLLGTDIEELNLEIAKEIRKLVDGQTEANEAEIYKHAKMKEAILIIAKNELISIKSEAIAIIDKECQTNQLRELSKTPLEFQAFIESENIEKNAVPLDSERCEWNQQAELTKNNHGDREKLQYELFALLEDKKQWEIEKQLFLNELETKERQLERSEKAVRNLEAQILNNLRRACNAEVELDQLKKTNSKRMEHLKHGDCLLLAEVRGRVSPEICSTLSKCIIASINHESSEVETSLILPSSSQLFNELDQHSVLTNMNTVLQESSIKKEYQFSSMVLNNDTRVRSNIRTEYKEDDDYNPPQKNLQNLVVDRNVGHVPCTHSPLDKSHRLLTPSSSIIDSHPPKPKRTSTGSNSGGRVTGIPTHTASRQHRLRRFTRSLSESDNVAPTDSVNPTPEQFSATLSMNPESIDVNKPEPHPHSPLCLRRTTDATSSGRHQSFALPTEASKIRAELTQKSLQQRLLHTSEGRPSTSISCSESIFNQRGMQLRERSPLQRQSSILPQRECDEDRNYVNFNRPQ